MLRRRLAVAVIALATLPGLAGCVAPPPSNAGAPTAPPTALPTADPATNWAGEMLAAVNAQRAAAGAGPLQLCWTLSVAAQQHSADQAARSTMSHTGANGSTMSQRADRAGYGGWRALGENVAWGYRDVPAVMAGWMGSTGHRQNLLNPAFSHIGVGRAASSSGALYWTQDFGSGGTCQ